MSQLTVNGTLKVVSAPPPPVITGIGQSGNNVSIAGAGGAPGTTYRVLTTTNLALGNWTAVVTNLFLSDGSFLFTAPVDPAKPQLFYRLQVP